MKPFQGVKIFFIRRQIWHSDNMIKNQNIFEINGIRAIFRCSRRILFELKINLYINKYTCKHRRTTTTRICTTASKHDRANTLVVVFVYCLFFLQSNQFLYKLLWIKTQHTIDMSAYMDAYQDNQQKYSI